MQVSLSFVHLKTWHVSLLLDTVISSPHLEGKDQSGIGFYLSVES